MELVRFATGEPITRAQLEAEVSVDGLELTLPQNLTGVDLTAYGVAPVIYTDPAPAPAGQVIERNGVTKVGNKWYTAWATRALTDAEQDALIPMEVTMRQARLALLEAGKLAATEAALQSLPEPQRSAALIEWEYAQTVRRDHQWVQALFAAIGLNSASLKALFASAATK